MQSLISKTLRAAACVFACAAVLALGACDKKDTGQKKQRTVLLMPDTPPPPPPPPPPEKEKPPEPEKQDKPQPQPDVPKPETPPEPQALKSDEAAGDGPGNGLTSGAVTEDYKSQQIGGSAGGSGINRLAFEAYGKSASRTFNEYFARDRNVRQRGDYKVEINVWIDADGRLQRSELAGSTGDPETDEAVRTALARFPGLRTPPPQNLPQPIRLLITNRLIG